MSQARQNLLAVCVGNTHLRAGLWRGGRMRRSFRRPIVLGAKALAAELLGARPATVLLAGTAPGLVAALAGRLSAQAEVRRFRRDFPCPLRVAPRPATRVGEDRLAAALGALALDPAVPWVVADAGTAVTVNAVRPAAGGVRAGFEGGLIFPGEALALRALNLGTAQLPAVKPYGRGRGRVAAVGRSTGEAMKAGVRRLVEAALVETIRAQARELGPRTRLALTGGAAANYWRRLRRELKTLSPVFRPCLALEGLVTAWVQSEAGPRSRGR